MQKRDDKTFSSAMKIRKAECEAKEQEYAKILRDYFNQNIK